VILSRWFSIMSLLVALMAPSAEGQPLRFTFVSPFIGHPYWDVISQGVRTASTELGVNTIETGPIGEVNFKVQAEAFEVAIASKVDGILTAALNPEVLVPLINRAVAAGIPVVLIDTDAPNSNRSAYVGTSNYDAGLEAGKVMANQMGGRARVGIVTGDPEAENLNQRVAGFRKAVALDPGIRIVDVQPGQSDLLLATTKTRAMLRAHPDINALFGVSAECAIAAGRVVEEDGLVGKITILGFDDLPETLDFIRRGVVFGTLVQGNARMGFLGIHLLFDLRKGKKPTNLVVDTGVTLVTRDNVDSFRKNVP